MWPKKSSDNYLKDQLDPLIDALDLTPLQKQFLRSRWLDQVLWMEGRAGRDQKRYHLFRLMAIVGGVIVPALTTLNISGGAGSGFRWSAFWLLSASPWRSFFTMANAGVTTGAQLNG